MTHIESGNYGAKRATWRDRNPRLRLRLIIQQNPDVDENVWRAAFWNEVKDDEDEVRAIVEYWLDNAIRAILPKRKTHFAELRRSAAKATEAAKEQLSARINQEAWRIVLLDLMMPNGKTLGECTGQDCQRFGGWFSALAKKVPAKARVADTLSEQQVFSLWQANKNKK